MKTILAPLDFSDVTGAVLATATELAHAFEGKIVLLHVAMPEPAFVGYDPGPVTVQEDVVHEYAEEQTKLEHIRDSITKTGANVSVIHEEGPTLERILQVAKEQRADWIVIGSHGHTAFHQMLVGSVAHGVLRHAACPVVVVPSHRH